MQPRRCFSTSVSYCRSCVRLRRVTRSCPYTRTCPCPTGSGSRRKSVSGSCSGSHAKPLPESWSRVCRERRHSRIALTGYLDMPLPTRHWATKTGPADESPRRCSRSRCRTCRRYTNHMLRRTKPYRQATRSSSFASRRFPRCKARSGAMLDVKALVSECDAGGRVVRTGKWLDAYGHASMIAGNGICA